MRLGRKRKQGEFTHFLCRALQNYFPPSDYRSAPLETYSTLVNRIKSLSKDAPNQNIVSFIGESMKMTKLFSSKRLLILPNAVHVEAVVPGDDAKIFISTGSLGLSPDNSKIATLRCSHNHDCVTHLPTLNGVDPFITQLKPVAVASSGFHINHIKAGDTLQVLPNASHTIAIVVPRGTGESDPELNNIAQRILNNLIKREIANKDSKVIEYLTAAPLPQLGGSSSTFTVAVCRNNVNRPHDESYSRIKQFIIDPDSPLIATPKYQLTATLKFGLDLCDLRNYEKAISFFSNVIVSTSEQQHHGLDKEDADLLLGLATKYTRYAHLQSQFFLAAVIPQEDNNSENPQNNLDTTTCCLSYLCPPTNWSELTDIAVRWYWRTWKVDRLAKMQKRPIPGISLGYRNTTPVPLGLKEEEEEAVSISNLTIDNKLSPINMQAAIITKLGDVKVGITFPKSVISLLQDHTKIDLTINLRDNLSEEELDLIKKKLARPGKTDSPPKKRYRFHVLDCRADGTIKDLVRATSMAGFSVNIPLTTLEKATTVRLGHVTARHEIVPLYFRQSKYQLRAPMTHVFIVMAHESDDANPPLFDCRFFEQTPDINLDAHARRSFIQFSPETLQMQVDQRRLTKPNEPGAAAAATATDVIDGDSFHVEWLKFGTIPSASISSCIIRLCKPSYEIIKRIGIN
jgi:hypothetical protein